MACSHDDGSRPGRIPVARLQAAEEHGAGQETSGCSLRERDQLGRGEEDRRDAAGSGWAGR